MNVLSTKCLTADQRQLILKAGMALEEYDAIEIGYTDFAIDRSFQNALFTSKHAVKAFLNKTIGSNVEGPMWKCFCVGEKTKALLEDNGLNVVKMMCYGADLGHFIAKNHKNESFLFFCGNKRREEIPKILKENSIDYREVTVYRTVLIPKKQSQDFDGILFFSPSAVESFISSNKINDAMVFCIGNTTAKKVKKYTDKVFISNTPTIESVVELVVEKLKL